MTDTTIHLHETIDAQVWAEEFCNRFGPEGSIHQTPCDKSLMIGWFSNAIMTSYDLRTRQLHKEFEQEMLDYTAFMSTRPFCEHLQSPHFLAAFEEWKVEKQRRLEAENESCLKKAGNVSDEQDTR